MITAIKWTESEIIKFLATNGSSPFCYRQAFVAVANVSYGFFNHHEADLVICSKAGFLTEIEIKLSAQDWRNDRHKEKFGIDAWGKLRTGGWAEGLIKSFYYAAPAKLAQRWAEFGIPDWAGVIAVTRDKRGPTDDPYYVDSFDILREAKTSPQPKRLTPERMAVLARLGAMRVWTR